MTDRKSQFLQLAANAHTDGVLSSSSRARVAAARITSTFRPALGSTVIPGTWTHGGVVISSQAPSASGSSVSAAQDPSQYLPASSGEDSAGFVTGGADDLGLETSPSDLLGRAGAVGSLGPLVTGGSSGTVTMPIGNGQTADPFGRMGPPGFQGGPLDEGVVGPFVTGSTSPVDGSPFGTATAGVHFPVGPRTGGPAGVGPSVSPLGGPLDPTQFGPHLPFAPIAPGTSGSEIDPNAPQADYNTFVSAQWQAISKWYNTAMKDTPTNSEAWQWLFDHKLQDMANVDNLAKNGQNWQPPASVPADVAPYVNPLVDKDGYPREQSGTREGTGPKGDFPSRDNPLQKPPPRPDQPQGPPPSAPANPNPDDPSSGGGNPRAFGPMQGFSGAMAGRSPSEMPNPDDPSSGGGNPRAFGPMQGFSGAMAGRSPSEMPNPDDPSSGGGNPRALVGWALSGAQALHAVRGAAAGVRS
jgi:hypothetical protein